MSATNNLHQDYQSVIRAALDKLDLDAATVKTSTPEEWEKTCSDIKATFKSVTAVNNHCQVFTSAEFATEMIERPDLWNWWLKKKA